MVIDLKFLDSLLKSDRSPLFLNKGVTIANFHSFGIQLFIKQKLIKSLIGWLSVLDEYLIILIGISVIPLDETLSNSVIIFSTSSADPCLNINFWKSGLLSFLKNFFFKDLKRSKIG